METMTGIRAGMDISNDTKAPSDTRITSGGSG
jgi:hypothetical protein